MNTILEPAGYCVTVKELKAWLAQFPDERENGEPTEVWIESGEGTSSPCNGAIALNYRVGDNGKPYADVVLGHL